jgi:hypothetical protein
MSNWKAVGVATEGQSILVGGINIWNYGWVRKSDDPVELPHPAHPHQNT